MGASNLAVRRGAKANRRKAIVAMKRKAQAAEATPAAQAVRAAALPVRYCVINRNVFETGMGSLILARGGSVGPVVVGGFLLDTFCRGVKDVTFQTIEAEQLEAYLDVVNDATPLVPVDPSFARKLVGDLVRWAGSFGFHPPRTFAALERLFGDADPRACDSEFEFGQDGKPFYMSGLNESPKVGRTHVKQLLDQLGPDGFDFLIDDDDDDDSEPPPGIDYYEVD
jgi:hypothetical protein